MTPEEIKEAYTSSGYSVVAFTDHNVLIPHPELVDDTHSKEACFGGFTMIKAEKFEYKTITDALIAGNFYASQ